MLRTATLAVVAAALFTALTATGAAAADNSAGLGRDSLPAVGLSISWD